MSNITPNLGSVIPSATVRKIIYSAYVILLVVAGALQVAFAAPELGGQPTWLSIALNVLAYLGVPIGGLAIANAVPSAIAIATDDQLTGE